MAMGEVFRGFLIQARDAADGTSLIGSFDITQSGGLAQTLNCGDSGQDSTVSCKLCNLSASRAAKYFNEHSPTQVTHTSRMDKTRVSVTWTAPASTGVVEMR